MKILSTKEKIRYIHWKIDIGIFWLGTPWFLVGIVLVGLIYNLTIDSAMSCYRTLPLQGVWYGKAVSYIFGVIYTVLCICLASGSIYVCVFLYNLFFDKDILSQKHYKRRYICKNPICMGCQKKDKCKAAAEY